MGTRLTTQKRGKGSPTYRTPGHRYFANITYSSAKGVGQVVGFVHDAGRTSMLAKILMDDGATIVYNIAAEGLATGDKIVLSTTPTAEGQEKPSATTGSILPLADVPDGAMVFNVESTPRDGGKIGRSSGSFATLVGRDEETGLVLVRLGSREIVKRSPKCRATLGVACGGGRLEKPFKKAGNRRAAMRARNRLYPHVRGTAMSAYDHPHGGRGFGKSTTISRDTPPGRKVGLIAARRSGRKKGKSKAVAASASKPSTGSKK